MGLRVEKTGFDYKPGLANLGKSELSQEPNFEQALKQLFAEAQAKLQPTEIAGVYTLPKNDFKV
ncbi:hypothetical protein A2311_03210 [candidate division WOR-1 bacterium RIFOXYB2_FULL_48_7]|uniref:Uncharacterized protein n=1 Tax=candidate division WOR-1 bacterium RIFOXYB2_FULL_48_7 TaxID=1802583 RepID=A0A1F4T8D8_UNCSA|nr:MAG: hypothetical protein A2311_03210 [candidate division WOR-1 bacterium RIFOXYB2_FULL_48_7]